MRQGALKPGHILSEKYEIVRLLYNRAERSVYLCKESHRKGFTAIKELWGGQLPEGEKNVSAQQFGQEIKILRTLNNPGIPKFLGSFSEGQWHYLVMEYIEGKTLKSIKSERGQSINVKEAVSWAIQICKTFHYLHHRARPIIFRDLKPSHAMLSDAGQIKLVDFGVARFFDDIKTKDTYVMGTFGFAAPEQYGTKQTDPRSDIYTLGSTLFDLLTREGVSHFVFDFPPIRKLNREVPPWLEVIISQCLEKEPEKRHQSALKLTEKLEKGYRELR